MHTHTNTYTHECSEAKLFKFRFYLIFVWDEDKSCKGNNVRMEECWTKNFDKSKDISQNGLG